MYWSAYGVPCSEKQALFLIITFSISAWMGTGTSGFRVGLSVMTSMFPYRDSLLFCQGQFLFSLQLFVLQSYCTLKVYINFLGAYLVLYP